jgi:proteic killer suppression protein
VIRTFKGKDARAILGGAWVKSVGSQMQQRVREKLKYLDAAVNLQDLMIPPSNQLVALKGDRKGQ